MAFGIFHNFFIPLLCIPYIGIKRDFFITHKACFLTNFIVNYVRKYHVRGGIAVQEIFNYDSKLMQFLMKLADMIIMNILFILFSIPIITIGAAQSGLCAGIRQMMNKEDDNSAIKAFFKGFANGFGKITLVHTGFLLVMLLFVFLLYGSLLYSGGAFTLPAIMCSIALVIFALFYAMLAPFHAHFDCTPWQLTKNMYFVVFAYFLRAVPVAVLVWLPIIVGLVDFYIFMKAFPVWTFIYYSFAYLFVISLMKKPFADLRKQFLDSKNIAALPEDTQAEESAKVIEN